MFDRPRPRPTRRPGYRPQMRQKPTVFDARKERRVDERYDVSFETQIKSSMGQSIKGVIKDISESGCRVAITSWRKPEVDEVYSIKFGALEVQMGWTVWAQDESAGFKFAYPLSRYVVAHLAQLSQPQARPSPA
ncbi:MAG: PilZ domain-containing protein [Pseudomonadota bacterium]